MRAFTIDGFALPLPAHHRFPAGKYALLRRRVEAAGFARLEVPAAATDEQILRAHSPEYLRKVVAGELTRAEQQATGLPWSPQLVERARRSVGATIAACRAAVEDGVAVSLAGGTHHAFRDRGEGFCVFNDCAIAARALQAEGLARRALIVDCDVHQGDGSASILAGDASIFTFSIHAERNYPFAKQASDLDVGLPDLTGDAEYLAALAQALAQALERSQADFAIYLAGADPYAGDRLGKLSLSKKGLARRDRLVLESCAARALPVAVTMGGGYAEPIEDTVDIYYNTVKAAWRLYVRRLASLTTRAASASSRRR
ncbi:MAG: histone deacetylase [Betaproteobacteria bacterium]|nr:histone deacetylase [Betaproteobacteria bacterium]